MVHAVIVAVIGSMDYYGILTLIVIGLVAATVALVVCEVQAVSVAQLEVLTCVGALLVAQVVILVQVEALAQV